MVLQSLIFARFQGGKGPFLAVRFFFQKISVSRIPFWRGDSLVAGAPAVALRCVWTVSYSSGLECILPISNSYFLLEFSTNAYL